MSAQGRRPLRRAARETGRPQHQAHTLLEDLDQITDDLDAGTIVVFTNDSIRLRKVPVKN